MEGKDGEAKGEGRGPSILESASWLFLASRCPGYTVLSFLLSVILVFLLFSPHCIKMSDLGGAWLVKCLILNFGAVG